MHTVNGKDISPTETRQQDIALPGSDKLTTLPKDSAALPDADGSVGWGPFSKLPSSGSGLKPSARPSEQGEKYHTDVQAFRATMPEGLARVLDILVKAVHPKQAPQNSNTEKSRTDHG